MEIPSSVKFALIATLADLLLGATTQAVIDTSDFRYRHRPISVIDTIKFLR